MRGGLSVERVRELLRDGGADVALDVAATPAQAAAGPASSLVTTSEQAMAVLGIGSSGPHAQLLAVPGVRRLLAACVDTSTRTRVAAALGRGLASPGADLLAGLPAEGGAPSPSASRTAAGASSPAATVTATPSPTASPSPSATAAPAVRCQSTPALAGVTLSLLVPDAAPLRAAAAVLAKRLAVTGVVLTAVPVSSATFAARARAGGWDLVLALRPVRYPAPRALLAPLLDAGWRGPDAVALLRSPVGYQLLRLALRTTGGDAETKAWKALRAFLASSATLLPLADLNAVYPRGLNVAYAPTVPTFSNVDPTNVSLGSTRTGEPARTPTPTP